jgi:hypothetical protein
MSPAKQLKSLPKNVYRQIAIDSNDSRYLKRSAGLVALSEETLNDSQFSLNDFHIGLAAIGRTKGPP